MSMRSKWHHEFQRGAAERFASFAAFLALTAVALFLGATFIGIEFGGSTVGAAISEILSERPMEVSDHTIGGELSQHVITFAR